MWTGVSPRGGDGADDEVRLRDRIRLAIANLVLVTVAFAISPGRILPDTKLDMPLNPAAFLGRALHMWDSSEYFGQVQNQAYGYLFPMGPFFLLGRTAGLVPWVIQRLWLAAVLCTAFMGIVLLARALGIGTPNGRLIAGFGYALAPRAQELLAVNSSEFLPMAVLPWILLPLVHGSTRGSPRRAAALSALAVVCCGGINATAELAVLAVPLIYLLTRAGGPRKRRLLGWWLGCTAAASFWWLAPGYLMGRYIFPFLGYTENATTTTEVTSLTDVLRGTSQWLGFLPGAPWWPAGNALSMTPLFIVATAAVAGLGLAGLMGLPAVPGHPGRTRRDLPERGFLILTLLLGVAITVTGHASAVAAPFTGQLRDLLDGALAPLRNIHKFDPLVRLPLILGLLHLLNGPVTVRHPGRIGPGRTGLGRTGADAWRPTAAGLAVIALAASLLPVLHPGLGPQGSPLAIAGYERSAAAWLDRNTGNGTVLAVPGQRFGEFVWGRVMDDPLQSLLSVRWANRMVVPYGSAGLGRILQAVDERFATGHGSMGLAQVLARFGVRYLLVRNDIDRGALGSAWPARVHQAIAGTPGLTRVAAFGGDIRSGSPIDAVGGFDQPYKAVEIYQVPQPAPIATMAAGSRPLRVIGGPEALLTLADQGLLPTGRPVLFNDDPGAARIPAADTIITDTLRRREVNFSDLRNGSSATMTAHQPYTGASKVKDLTAPGWDRYRTVVRYAGIAAVTASSSASDSTAIPSEGSRAHQPYAAIDGDPGTSWLSSGWHGATGEWLMVTLDRPPDLSQITASFVVSDLLGPPVAEVSVETAAGTLRQRVRAVRTAQVLATPRGRTGWVRVRVTKTAGPPMGKIGTRVGISELTIPGVRAERYLAVPAGAATPPATTDATTQTATQTTQASTQAVPPATAPASAPASAPAATLAFTGRGDAAPPCMPGSRTWVCSPFLEQLSEDGNAFNRIFTSAAPGDRTITGSAVLTDPGLLRRYTAQPGPTVAASSSLVQHPADDARSAFDGDPTTSWIAGADDTNPRLTIDFGRTVEVSEFTLRFPNESGPPPGVHVQVSGSDGSFREGLTSRKGRFVFAPMRTDRLVIDFPRSPGIQIRDLIIPGVPPLGRPSTAPLTMGCGSGPTFTLGARTVPTRLVGASPADLLHGRAVGYASCGSAPVGTGEQRLSVPATDPYRITEAVLSPATAAGTPNPIQAQSPAMIRNWGPESRSVNVQASAEGGYLTVNENFNAGWTAALDGTRLQAVRIDGWRQGWVVPAGSHGTVRLEYRPGPAYRAMLLAGLLLVLLLIVAAATPARAGRPEACWPVHIQVTHISARPRIGPRWRWPIAAAIGLVAGGFTGLVLVPAVCALAGRTRPRPWIGALLTTLAGGVLAADAYLRDSGQDGLAAPLADAVPQVLCLTALGLLIAALGVPPADRPDAPVIAVTSPVIAVAERASRSERN